MPVPFTAPLFFTAISLLFNAVFQGAAPFMPNWMNALPVDAFTLRNNADFTSISVTLPPQGEEAVDGEGAAGAPALLLRKNGAGFFDRFPVWDGGRFIQAAAGFEQGRVARISGGADGEGEEGGAFEIVFLEYDAAAARPSLARLEQNGAYFFISFAYYAGETVETWFSAEGAFLAACRIFYPPEKPFQWTRLLFSSDAQERTARCFYDSFGGVTELAAGEDRWTAINDMWGPRYLAARRFELLAVEAGGEIDALAAAERVEHLAIQKDERALPVAARVFDGEREYTLEYRYRFDARGNWTEREELRYEEKSGLLIPVRRSLTRRAVLYGRAD
jgi:hypothetical protein